MRHDIIKLGLAGRQASRRRRKSFEYICWRLVRIILFRRTIRLTAKYMSGSYNWSADLSFAAARS